MLSQIVTIPLSILTLGSRAHAILLADAAKACAEVFERDKETCHICGTRIPGFMDVDHIQGHKPCTSKDMRCICPFCHDLRHPLWAASHRRIIPIYAPDLSQADITRLAWTLIGLRGIDGAAAQVSRILEDVKKRATRLAEILVCSEAEPLFEAAFTAREVMGEKKSSEVLLGIDQYLRFFPAELLRESKDPISSGLSSWRLGGFLRLEEGVADAARGGKTIDIPRLEAAAASVTSKPDPRK